MVWIILAIIFFILYLVLHISADRYDSENPVRKETVRQKTKAKSAFWNEFKKNNPAKAQELVEITNRDFERLDELSTKEIIDAFEYVANRNHFSSYIPVKEYLLNLYIQVYEDCGLEECKKAINQIVSEELNIKTDANACKVSQYFNGTNDTNVFVCNCVYELSDFNIDDIKVQYQKQEKEHNNIHTPLQVGMVSQKVLLKQIRKWCLLRHIMQQ